jgi:two-component system, LytTR family, response regulator
MIRTILVDDDPKHLESLAGLLGEHFKQVEILATCANVPDAARKIDELKPQLVFLDIEMSPYTGFDLLEMVDERDFEVIFTTNYNRYAIQAIKASALDFIEKPLNKISLGDALFRYKEKTGKVKMQNLLSNFKLSYEDQKIALPDKSGLHFYELKNIVRCQSENSYTEFYIIDETKKSGATQQVVVSTAIKDFEDLLMDKGFFYRVHNQHIVNINYIKKFAKDNGSYLVLDVNPREMIPVARSRKDDFMGFLRSKGIII